MKAQPVYVIDTSYLLELYAVPGHSTQEAVDEIRSRFKDAVKQNARLYVTVPSIYELANHIASVSNGNARWPLAKKLQDDILCSINKAEPWMIIPSQELSSLKKLIVSFVDNHVREGIGLSDSTLIDEAHRLKRTTYEGSDWRVHIWTKDKNLKAREPDNEPHAYLG